MPTVILCADDFAIAPGVSRAIASLIEAGRLTATGCMTASRFWPDHAVLLRPLADEADIGVHLTLTDQSPLGAMPRTAPSGRLPNFGELLRRSLAGGLALDEVEAEMGRQLDAFERWFGSPPAFLDGHQHVHQLPGIRERIIALCAARAAGRRPYLRVCSAPLSVLARRRVAVGRAALIGFFGGALRRLAAARGIAVNDGFSGIYDFSGRRPYGELFERFLIGVRDRSVIVCHPGVVDDALIAVDSLTAQREAEYRYFESAAFPAALLRADVRLGRYARP